MTAKIYDYTPEAFNRTLDKSQAAGDAQAATAADDMVDGILALDFALTFAGFSYEARQLTLSVVGQVGGRGDRLELYDKELAARLHCSDRTIRRWRAAHVREAKAKRISLLKVEESEYSPERKRYERAAYSLTAGDYVNQVVAEARASESYQTDRLAAVERAAEEHYDEIPDAPPRAPRRKPKRSPSVKVEQAFVNAAKNVEKGRRALRGLSADSRAALLAGSQGEELRQTLLRLQVDINEVLESFPQKKSPQDAEGEEVDRGYRTKCPIPLHVRRPLSEEPRAEDVAAWEQIERRAAGEPRVRSRELELRPPWGLQTHDVPEEELEAEAIRAEASGELQ
jgi:hypothetical protein